MLLLIKACPVQCNHTTLQAEPIWCDGTFKPDTKVIQNDRSAYTVYTYLYSMCLHPKISPKRSLLEDKGSTFFDDIFGRVGIEYTSCGSAMPEKLQKDALTIHVIPNLKNAQKHYLTKKV